MVALRDIIPPCIMRLHAQRSYLLIYTVLNICAAKYSSAQNKGAIVPDRTFAHALTRESLNFLFQI